MATSPIYGWLEPDNTDLVKNGALAIRTLGNAIDTTMGTMVAKTIIDAKGDLIAGSAADTALRLAVGSNGETLVADSSTSTGLRYQGNYAAGKNKIINGDFNIWQRGTSSSGNGYLADRWFMTYSVAPTTFTQSRQTFTPGTAPVAGYESRYFWRYAITTVGSNTDMYIGQLIEDVTTFAGQTMTFSIWLKADSARSVSLSYNQNFGSGGSSAVSAQVATYSVTTAWTRFSTTISIPSIAGKTIGTSSYLQFFLSATPASGFSLDCWGVQAEAGSVATAFQTATGTIQGELDACQRYYETGYQQNQFDTSGKRYLKVRFNVTKRGTPSIAVSDANALANTVTTKNGYLSSSTNAVTGYFISENIVDGFNIGDNSNAANYGLIANWTATAEL
jgi:hypothetical protein